VIVNFNLHYPAAPDRFGARARPPIGKPDEAVERGGIGFSTLYIPALAVLFTVFLKIA
jgi:hypothetical protein